MDEPRVYLIFDKIGPRLRAFTSLLLILAGFMLQFGTKNILAGMPFIIACVLINAIRGVSVKKVTPDTLAWEVVTERKIDEVVEHCRSVKKFRSSRAGCCAGLVVIMIFAVVFISPLIEWSALPFPLMAAVVNAFLLTAGLVVGGRKSAWMPRALDTKVDIIKTIMGSALIRDDPELTPIPYLEIGRAGSGTFPNDARLLIKLKQAPDDLIGLQVQISINTVRSRDYPYLYGVLVARPGFGLFERFKASKSDFGRLTVEQKKTAEVDVIVLRQATTKTSGYHTDEKTQEYILKEGIKAAKCLV